MSRARVLGTLLALILLACAVVIALDQSGALGGRAASSASGGSAPVTEPVTSGDPAGDGGYGDLR